MALTPHAPTSHPDVGTYTMEYAFSSESGTITRYCFTIKVGDDPNWWLAQRLMPGAVNIGKLHAVFEAESDTGAVHYDEVGRFYDCELVVRGSVFRTKLWATGAAELFDRLQQIGGLSWVGFKPIRVSSRFPLFLRYYWLRRPCIRRRSPLDIFNIL